MPGLEIRFPKLNVPSAPTVVDTCSMIWFAASSTENNSTVKSVGTTPPSVPLTTTPLISLWNDWALTVDSPPKPPKPNEMSTVAIKKNPGSRTGQASGIFLVITEEWSFIMTGPRSLMSVRNVLACGKSLVLAVRHGRLSGRPALILLEVTLLL